MLVVGVPVLATAIVVVAHPTLAVAHDLLPLEAKHGLQTVRRAMRQACAVRSTRYE